MSTEENKKEKERRNRKKHNTATHTLDSSKQNDSAAAL